MNKTTRKDFLKKAALTAAGAAAIGVALPLIADETKAEFDPNNSYWAKEQPEVNPPLKTDITADVVIIGGGYTGLSAAWHLANENPGLVIVVLEAHHTGHGASGRNGGMVLPQIGAESFEIAYDMETHKWTYDLTVDSMKRLRKLIKSTGVDCGLEMNGYCHTIFEKEDLSYYEDYVKKAHNAGIPVELWDEKKTEAEFGTDIYYGAVYDPKGGHVHAMKMVKALKKAAEDAGVIIYENTPVISIDEGVNIRLKAGENKLVTARAIVLATNGYTSKLGGYFKHRVMPMHAQCAATSPLTKKQMDDIAWESRLPFYDSRNMLYHLVLTEENRIVIGGGNAEYFFGNNLHYKGDIKKIENLMMNELITMYPALKGIKFENIWNGILGMSFEEIEGVGVTGKHNNIYYGLAYNGHGINTSFMFGNIIASLYSHKKHGWSETAYYNTPLKRMPPEPYKWIGVQFMLGYYRWLDK